MEWRLCGILLTPQRKHKQHYSRSGRGFRVKGGRSLASQHNAPMAWPDATSWRAGEPSSRATRTHACSTTLARRATGPVREQAREWSRRASTAPLQTGLGPHRWRLRGSGNLRRSRSTICIASGPRVMKSSLARGLARERSIAREPAASLKPSRNRDSVGCVELPAMRPSFGARVSWGSWTCAVRSGCR